MTKSFGHKAGAAAGKITGVAGAKLVAGAEALGTGGMDFFAAFGDAATSGYAAEREAAAKRVQARLAAAAAQAAKLEMAKA